MAGQPRRRALVAEIERRADLREMTPLEYAVDWVESGKTLVQLTADINDKLGTTEETGTTRSMLSRYLHSLEGGTDALAAARPEGAHGMAERALEVIDQPAENKVEAAQRKTQGEMRIKLAGFMNRAEYGEQRGPQVAVTFDLGALHLDALRLREAPAAHVALPPAVEGEDYDVVSDAG